MAGYMLLWALAAAEMQDDGAVVAVLAHGGTELLGSARSVHAEPEEPTPAPLLGSVQAEPDGRTATLWQELRRDPVVVVSVVLLLAGFIFKLVGPNGEGKKSRGGARGEKRAAKSPVQINKAILAQPTADAVLDVVTQSAERVDMINLVTALHRCSKLKPVVAPTDARVQALLARLSEFLAQGPRPDLAARAVSTVSRALANMLGQTEPDEALHGVLDALLLLFLQRTADFKPEELTRTVHAFTDLRYRRSEVLHAAARSSALWGAWTDHDLVWIAWAFARLTAAVQPRLGSSAEVADALRVLSRLLARIRVGALPTKLVGMVAWAAVQVHLSLESRGDEVEVLLVAVADDCASRVAAFQPGEACSVLWALSKCHVAHAALFAACRDQALAKDFRGYKAQDLANMACAYVNMTRDEDPFLAQLAQAIEHHRYNEVERRMVQWAYAQRPHLLAPKIK